MYVSSDLTSTIVSKGPKVTTIPDFSAPVSARPTGTVPIPPIVYTSWRKKTHWLVGGPFGLIDHVQDLKKSQALVPIKVGRPFYHIVTFEALP